MWAGNECFVLHSHTSHFSIIRMIVFLFLHSKFFLIAWLLAMTYLTLSFRSEEAATTGNAPGDGAGY